MRRFIIYSQTASTDSKIRDLRSAGRWDILLHSIISAMFASNTFRQDVELHLILMGPPNSPRHIKITYAEGNTISKKDLKTLIEIALKKAHPGKTKEVHPGVFVDDKTLENVIEEYDKTEIYMLDSAGEHIKNTKLEEDKNPTFILGDYDGFDKQTKKYLKKNVNRLSLGSQMYFTSQAITIINYELDCYLE